MVKWQDGVKISDAHVNEDGTITEAEWEGDTPLKADNLNLMQKIDIASISLAKGTIISNNKEITLPLKYQVGNNSLEVRLNGEVLKLATNTEDGHYKEVGNEEELSNKIAFVRATADGNWTLTEDVTITVVVRRSKTGGRSMIKLIEERLEKIEKQYYDLGYVDNRISNRS